MHPHAEDLASFPFVHRIAVRFRDLDALGHVNNAVYLTYFESARIAYYQQLTGTRGAAALDVVVAHIQLSYRAPLFLDETLLLGVRVGHMRSKSFTMEYLGVREHDRRLIVNGESIQVAYDHSRGQSVHVSPALRAQVAAFQSTNSGE